MCTEGSGGFDVLCVCVCVAIIWKVQNIISFSVSCEMHTAIVKLKRTNERRVDGVKMWLCVVVVPVLPALTASENTGIYPQRKSA